ncbi:LSU ribosomal protein L25p [hydrothermal vent metagenome]|uniref:LSU ribosomal protein L25p n=1 Tax=hydrothermal vent metagenome TaxID=652676 RepID=A0A3B1CFJ0_9ZZZZ
MSEMLLAGSVRKAGKKGPARRLRVEGKLPGIVYGAGENVPVTVEAKNLLKMLEVKGGVNNILLTKFEGDSKDRHVMIKSLDVHPITDLLLHVDLIEIDVNKPVKVDVDIELTGVSLGVKEKGGQLHVTKDRVRLECLPKDIIPVLTLDITDLDIGETWRVKDLKVGENLTILDNPDSVVIAVAEPKVAVEKEETADEAAPATEGETSEGDKKE